MLLRPRGARTTIPTSYSFECHFGTSIKGGWSSTCISKCFGKEDGTVQGLGDGKGALKKNPSCKRKISILCYRIAIKE